MLPVNVSGWASGGLADRGGHGVRHWLIHGDRVRPANNRLTCPGRAPNEPDARLDVVAVGVHLIGTAGSTDLHQGIRRRIEQDESIFGLGRRQIQVVADYRLRA